MRSVHTCCHPNIDQDAEFLPRKGEVDPTKHLEGQEVICPIARLK